MTTHVILGATGHVGHAAATCLLEQGERVVAVTRDAAHAADLKRAGAEIAVADIRIVDALADVLSRGDRAFLLNPPADIARDTDAAEIATVDAILTAVSRVRLERVVAESTCGAQAGDRIGDLSVLYRLEEGLRGLATPAAIIRAAYYFTNWDSALASARDDGVVRTPYPADTVIPMVSPKDLGRTAAHLLTAAHPATGIHPVEGPERYAVQDVADAFAAALERDVRIAAVPRDEWEAMFRDLGFSAAAADSYERMTQVSVDGGFAMSENPIRGSISLCDHVAALVAR